MINYRDDLHRALEGMDLTPLRGKAMLITGATGLVGACLADMLLYADERFGLNLRLTGTCRDASRAAGRFDGMTLIERDAALPCEGLGRYDYVVHAASNAHPLVFSLDPVGTMMANVLGTRNLLEHQRATGGGRLLLISTGEIYGENPAVSDGFSEDDFGRIDPMNPRSCYPESKRAAETLCASYVSQYGLDAAAARLCYVYGPTVSPSNSRADAQFLRNALAGEDIVLKSAGSQIRSYCYVADAAAALLTILLRGQRGQAYNVASRESVCSIREYAETLAQLAGVRVTFDLPPEAERRGYSAVTRAVQNPSKLEALGWRARWTLREGLKSTLAALGRAPKNIETERLG